MVAYKSIVTSLVVILIFSCGVSGPQNNGQSSGYKDEEIENKEGQKNIEEKEEDKDEYVYITDNFENCRRFVNRVYLEGDDKKNENFHKSYKNLNYDVISSYFGPSIALAQLANTKSSLNAANIWEFQIQILDDFYKYLIDHHNINFKGKDQPPNKFCIDTAEEEFVYLNVNLKETETTSQKLAAVCIGLMKTIGIEEPDSATTELAFKMVYLNLYESILSYEGMTNIGQNDEKIDVIRNSEQKNRNLVMNTSDRTHHEKKRQKTCEHTIEERNDLDVYIKMFLKKYFQYFLDIIDTQKKTSAITNVTIESYCRNRGVQLVDESGVKIPQKKNNK